MKNTNKIVFFNILSTIILQGLTFFSSPIFSRLLGTYNYGIVSIYITWVSVISIVLSLQTYSTLSISRNRFGEDEQNAYQSSILCLSTLTYSFGSMIILLFLNQISELLLLSKTMIILILIQGFGQYCVNFYNAKNTYEFNAKTNFKISVSISFINISLSLFLIYNMNSENNYMGRILGQEITYLIFGFIICIYIFKNGKTFLNKKYWKFCIPLAVPIVFHNLSGLLLGQSDRIMLQYFQNNTSVGIYSLANSFSAVLSTIWTALNNSWCPFYFVFARQNEISNIKEHSKNYLELFTVISIGFVLLASDVYQIFSSKEFWDGISLIYVFAIGYYFVFLYSFAVNFEFFMQKTKLIAIGTLLAAIFNVILNVIFIKRYGALGAAVATTISHVLQFIFHHLIAKQIDKTNSYCYSIRMFAPYISVFLLLTAFAFIFEKLSVLRWVIAILLGVLEVKKLIKRRTIF